MLAGAVSHVSLGQVDSQASSFSADLGCNGDTGSIPWRWVGARNHGGWQKAGVGQSCTLHAGRAAP